MIDMVKCLRIIYEVSSDSFVLIKSSVQTMKKIYKFMRSWFSFQAPELSCVQLTLDVLENPLIYKWFHYQR